MTYIEQIEAVKTVSELFRLRDEIKIKENKYHTEYLNDSSPKAFTETLQLFTEAEYYVAVCDRRILHLERCDVFLDKIEVVKK